MKLAMVRVRNRMAETGLRSRMLLQVHDELIFEAPRGRGRSLEVPRPGGDAPGPGAVRPPRGHRQDRRKLGRAGVARLGTYKGNTGNLMQHWTLCETLSTAWDSGVRALNYIDAHAMAPMGLLRTSTG